jgi:hypothetical protein
MLHLALLKQVLDRTCGIFDGRIRVNPVLIEKIDDVGLERLERSFGDFLDVLWLTVALSGTSLRLGINFPTELGSDHDLPMDGRKGLAHEFFIRERAVRFGGIEEHDAALDCGLVREIPCGLPTVDRN